jgi:hypothetical protein
LVRVFSPVFLITIGKVGGASERLQTVIGVSGIAFVASVREAGVKTGFVSRRPGGAFGGRYASK